MEESKSCKIYVQFASLADEAELLFDEDEEVKKSLEKLRGYFEIMKKLSPQTCGWGVNEKIPLSEIEIKQQEDNSNLRFTTMKQIEDEFNICKRNIFSYLKIYK